MTSPKDIKLGIDSYPAHPSPLSTSSIDLSWTLDEQYLLDTNLSVLINNFLCTEQYSSSPEWKKYLVNDPYGGNTLHGAATHFFQSDIDKKQIFTGSGISSILYYLSHLTISGLQCIGPVYLDLPHWITLKKLPVYYRTALDTSLAADIILIEHPSFFNINDTLSYTEIIDFISKTNKILIIDESNGNYLPPYISYVNHTNHHNNLIVLRGFSKAYGLGSIRIGVCFCSKNIHPICRRFFPPLTTTPLSLGIAAALWSKGDIAKNLRLKISSQKPIVEAALARTYGINPIECNEYLPYILFDETAHSILNSSGIVGKKHYSATDLNPYQCILRLSVPLIQERICKLERFLISSCKRQNH